MKQILQQILASIKVTNIERYITEVERIREDIQARNFSIEDVDAMMELDNAKACEFMVLISVCVCLSGSGVRMELKNAKACGICVLIWCVNLGGGGVGFCTCSAMLSFFKDVSVVVDA